MLDLGDETEYRTSRSASISEKFQSSPRANDVVVVGIEGTSCPELLENKDRVPLTALIVPPTRGLCSGSRYRAPRSHRKKKTNLVTKSRFPSIQ